MNQTLVEPRRVWASGGEFSLDFVVLDDPAFGSVNQEHPPRLQPALAHDRGGVNIKDTGFRSKNDESLVCDPVTARAQTISVQNRTDHRAIGERHVGRAIPRLRKGCVVLVERTPSRVHIGVVLPCLGDHHQNCVGQRTTTKVEEFENLVE